MGVNVSRPNDQQVDDAAIRRSKLIDKEIQLDEKKAGKIVKLLLLGASESGKSTILKQMKILHHNGFDERERAHERMIIYDNIVQAMGKILRDMESFGVHFEDLEREYDANLVNKTIQSRTTFDKMPLDLATAIQRLGADNKVQQYISRAGEYDLSDSAIYFLDNFERISDRDYKPNEQDILRSRRATTGITEIVFEMNDLSFRVIDVGGQRSERRKWIHCFDNVNAVFFLTALSEYNQMLQEDDKQNRMMESLTLFKSVCNTRWFVNTAMILFLNKRDVFADKLKIHPLTIAFPDYKGSQTYHECVDYIQSRFESVKKNAAKQIYVHQTCATDTSNVQKVFDSCIVIIITNNLSQAGLSN